MILNWYEESDDYDETPSWAWSRRNTDYTEKTSFIDTTVKVELQLDAVIFVDEGGIWRYEDETYPWAQPPLSYDNRHPGDWYEPTEHGEIYITDDMSIVEDTDDLLSYCDDMPETPGKYHIQGQVNLIYDISNLLETYDPESGIYYYDHTYYSTDISFDRKQSSIENFSVEQLPDDSVMSSTDIDLDEIDEDCITPNLVYKLVKDTEAVEDYGNGDKYILKTTLQNMTKDALMRVLEEYVM